MTRDDLQSCEEALRLLALFLDHELGRPESSALEQHLEACRTCYSRAQFESGLKHRLAELGREDVSPGLARRVEALVRTFTVAGGR